MGFAKYKIRKRNLYFRTIMALSVPHTWKKGIFPICMCSCGPSLNQGMLFWLAAHHGGAMLVGHSQWDILALGGEKTWPLPVSPFSFTIYHLHKTLSLSLIVMVLRLKPGAEPCGLFPHPSCSQGENPVSQYFFWHHTEILQLLSSTDIWFSKK